jgi:cytoskeletal protein CcmA (bactofilin family)
MFASKKQNTTVIAEGLKIVGSIATDGLVEVYGQIDGEMRCASVVISHQAHVAGTMMADHVVVDGKVDGPIQCGEVILKSRAHVIGDIACDSVIIEKGAFIEGRLVRSHGANGRGRVAFAAEPARMLESDSVRKEELVEEARHLSGDPDLLIDEALAYLAKRGNAEAKAFLTPSADEAPPNGIQKRRTN